MHWLERHWYRITPLHILLLPVSYIFRLLVALRRALYRSGILPSEKLSVPVIVVGNITVGGSGKTPLTLWLAQQLIGEGWHPGIISRGFGGGETTAPQAVHASSLPDTVGDEAVLMAQRGLCPVWVGRDRPATGRALLNAHPECDVLLSDDGLQHYRLQRDAEIAVVDGVRHFGNGCLLPAGPLREAPSRLKEVDAVVINGGMSAGGEYWMQLDGSVFHNLLNPETIMRASDFHGLHLHAIAGIGHPQRFFSHLNNLGLEVQAHAFPDHHRYVQIDLAYADADAILMTEKDAVKCAAFATEKCWVLRVEAQLDPALTHYILERIALNGRQVT
jgi:tetraacyldisaccharide 4'-kinase